MSGEEEVKQGGGEEVGGAVESEAERPGKATSQISHAALRGKGSGGKGNTSVQAEEHGMKGASAEGLQTPMKRQGEKS